MVSTIVRARRVRLAELRIDGITGHARPGARNQRGKKGDSAANGHGSCPASKYKQPAKHWHSSVRRCESKSRCADRHIALERGILRCSKAQQFREETAATVGY